MNDQNHRGTELIDLNNQIARKRFVIVEFESTRQTTTVDNCTCHHGSAPILAKILLRAIVSDWRTAVARAVTVCRVLRNDTN